ncbi:DUF2271 domain-containing protein [Devosia sp.]|uniref:DUF2271 domain-containing protein n=1 Tax=Devosia sp. TaxID=1871048 RepID=UPI003A8F7463
MRPLTSALLLGTALLAPSAAIAKDISVDVQMVRYSGNPAYLAVYVTNPDGSYNSTLWVSGTRTRYLRDLRQWAKGAAAAGVSLDGITGASVGGGQVLTVNTSIADSLIDAGYEVHVDSAVEHGGSYSSDAVVPLTSAENGQPVDGTGYVSHMTVNF